MTIKAKIFLYICSMTLLFSASLGGCLSPKGGSNNTEEPYEQTPAMVDSNTIQTWRIRIENGEPLSHSELDSLIYSLPELDLTTRQSALLLLVGLKESDHLSETQYEDALIAAAREMPLSELKLLLMNYRLGIGAHEILQPSEKSKAQFEAIRAEKIQWNKISSKERDFIQQMKGSKNSGDRLLVSMILIEKNFFEDEMEKYVRDVSRDILNNARGEEKKYWQFFMRMINQILAQIT